MGETFCPLLEQNRIKKNWQFDKAGCQTFGLLTVEVDLIDNL